MSEVNQDYWIKGNSYELKEEIKHWGGVWVPEKRMWKIHYTNSNQGDYKQLEKLGLKLIPINLSPECKKIQDILNN